MRGRRALALGASVTLTVLCLTIWVKVQPSDRPAPAPRLIGDVEVSGACATASHQALSALEHRLDATLRSSRAYTGVALLKYCGPIDLYGTSPALLAGLAPK